MMGEQLAGPALKTEYADRETSDRARHAIAVKVEHGKIGRADIFERVHLHAIDDGEKILARQIELAHRPYQAGDFGADLSLVKRVDLVAPFGELGQPLRPRRS